MTAPIFPCVWPAAVIPRNLLRRCMPIKGTFSYLSGQVHEVDQECTVDALFRQMAFNVLRGTRVVTPA